MAYYNRDIERFKLKKSKREFVGHGGWSTIYRYGDIAFKSYCPDTDTHYKIKPEVFDVLKGIDNRHLIKLYDIYTTISMFSLFKERAIELAFNVQAYTAKYYENDSIDILYQPTDYILENFKELEQLFEILTNNRILTVDIHPNNSILQKNNIVIIDPDMFSFSEEDRESLSYMNKINLINLLEKLIVDNRYTLAGRGFYEKVTNDLIDFKISSSTDMTYELSKRLKNVKRPIDLFNKLR